ncbi:MAG: carboxypeptidase-like regulatory domain-containing protein, partial [Tannerella sp.]|nr:carboxypeptidase-like regulatory domain-containing protein [Tannerella sp.]
MKHRKAKFGMLCRTVMLVCFLQSIMAQGVNLTGEGAESAQPARKTVTGVIKDETDEPLAGAAVIVKGTPRGVTADSDGTFSIDVTANDILQMSYIGY